MNKQEKYKLCGNNFDDIKLIFNFSVTKGPVAVAEWVAFEP